MFPGWKEKGKGVESSADLIEPYPGDADAAGASAQADWMYCTAILL